MQPTMHPSWLLLPSTAEDWEQQQQQQQQQQRRKKCMQRRKDAKMQESLTCRVLSPLIPWHTLPRAAAGGGAAAGLRCLICSLPKLCRRPVLLLLLLLICCLLHGYIVLIAEIFGLL
jgi:hypothetical protein